MSKHGVNREIFYLNDQFYKIRLAYAVGTSRSVDNNGNTSA